VEEIIIKKYENRRLYNTREKKYISVSEIEDLIKQGHTIKVIEKKTGNDITKEILMQALLENNYEALPVFFIHMLIQTPSNLLKPFFDNYFPQFFNNYLNIMKSGLSLGAKGINPVNKESMPSFTNPFQNLFQQTANQAINPFINPFAKPQGNQDENISGSDEMQQILKRLAELESKLNKK
jgi:polyhydroxyalkanoate synthesis repressor PhaR